MKLLDGNELAGFIKERQAKEVRSLHQGHGVVPKLAIVQTNDTPVINSYVRLKQRYADDLGILLERHLIDQSEAAKTIAALNQDTSVHGIIVQLPLADPSETDQLVNAVAPTKDVDALGKEAQLTPATALAINWLLAGYNIALDNKKLVIVGRGTLVGRPLEKLWLQSGLQPIVIDNTTPEADFLQTVRAADVIVTATGTPGVITSDMVAPGATIIDAGVASEAGKLVGDLADDVRVREDLTLTPAKGGVGPLTVCALFDNVIIAARATITNQQ